MPEQIALLEIPLIDVSDRDAHTMVSELRPAKEVLGHQAKCMLTVNGARIEIWVEKRRYVISVEDLLEKSIASIKATLLGRIKERALAVHGTPPYPPAAQAARALFGAAEDERSDLATAKSADTDAQSRARFLSMSTLAAAAHEIAMLYGGMKLEEGANANGNYIKLSTGHLIMWGAPLGETLPALPVSAINTIVPGRLLVSEWFVLGQGTHE